MTTVIILIVLIAVIIAAAIIAPLLILLLVPPSNKGTGASQGNQPSLQQDYSTLPEIEYYSTRDGESMPFRYYHSNSDRVLIFLHGDSEDSRQLHTMANYMAKSGLAKVYTPDLRGFGTQPKRRGDVGYIGQVADDLADLIRFIKIRHTVRRLIIGGHCAGGGTAIKFAASEYGRQADGYLLLAPMIGIGAWTERKQEGAGAAVAVSIPRLVALTIFNALRIRLFNGLKVVRMNQPALMADAHHTLEWSYRLMASRLPGTDYMKDIQAVRKPTLVIIAEDDEQVDAEQIKQAFAKQGKTEVQLLGGKLTHDMIPLSADTAEHANDWMRRVFAY